MAKITKDSLISDVLSIDEGAAKYFVEVGMYCFGCPAAQAETLQEACTASGVDCDEFVEKLNDYLKDK